MCERFYADVFDCRRSVETGTHIKDFDVALFSLQFEEDYFRVARILQEVRAKTVAGGPCVLENPLPLAPLFDYFYVGEADGDVERLLEVVLNDSEEGCIVKSKTAVEMSESGERLKARKSNLSTHLQEQIIGKGVYGECFLLEVGRGCKRSCSFCVVKQIYRPCRWRNKDFLLELAKEAKVSRIALISPSVTDHPDAKELMWELANMGFEVSPSSMRADTIDEEMAELLVACGQKSVTIAPEAGSERLRKILRKGISEEDVISAAENVSKAGIKNVKMYYMVGIPKENESDVLKAVELAEKVKSCGLKVTVSVNPLVPKPHTPLQFAPFGGFEDLRCLKAIKALKKRCKLMEKEFFRRGIQAKVEKVEDFAIQTILSRGNIDVGIKLHERKNFLKNFLHYLEELSPEKKPWEFIDHSYSPERLRAEYKKLMEIT